MIKTLENKKNIFKSKIIKNSSISLIEKLKISQNKALKWNFKNFDENFLNNFYKNAKKRNLINN